MKSWTLSSARAWLFVVLFLSTFIFVRVYQNTPVFFIPSPADDTGYLAYTESILKGYGFDWCQPGITDGNLRGQCNTSLSSEGRAHAYNMYSPGPAIALLPFNAIGALLHKLHIFTPNNVNPFVFWSIIGTFFLFAIATLLLFECTLYYLKDIRSAWWLTVCFIIGNPITYYVMRRPLMSHVVEFFLFFVGIYLLIRILNSSKPILLSFLLGLSAGLMMITRLNNIHIPAIMGIMLLFWPGDAWKKERFKKVLSYLAGGVPFILVFLWINYMQKGTFLYSTQNYYEAYTIGFFLKLYAVNPLRMLHWFFGQHWGIVWLVPLFIYEFYYFLKNRAALWAMMSGSRILPVALIAAVLLVHFNIMANGPSAMSYAYRYVFTYYFLLHTAFLIAFAKFGWPKSKNTYSGFSRTFQVILLVSMLIGSCHILNYESKVKRLRPQMLEATTESIYHPFWRDTKIWTTPKFAIYSLVEVARGTPVMNLVGSPLAAAPIIAVADSWMARLPGMNLAIEYYRSVNRNVYRLEDLVLTYLYQLFFGIAAAVAYGFTCRLRKL